ncbi:MAG: alpha-hydroxy acid oxidase [Pseudomonadota bacterium]
MITLSDIRFSEIFAQRPMDMRFPSIAAMERAAQRRTPKFAWDYTSGGIGDEQGRARNISAFHDIRFMPQYLREIPPVDLTTEILGQTHAAPFAPGPVGLTGLMWPNAPLHIMRAAASHGLPSGLSSVATSSLEEGGEILGRNLWFQLYPMKDEAAEQDILKRFEAVGGEVLLVTVDVPGQTRRARDVGNGLAVPPRQDWRTWARGAMRPRWAVETFFNGMPSFKTVERYNAGDTAQNAFDFLKEIFYGHCDIEKLKKYREWWPGKIVVKGLLSLEDVRTAMDVGIDGVIVSNHGGRQLDAAPTAVEVLPQIRQLVGGKMAVLADGGVRTGLDIAKYLALGADFVLLGRPMVFAVCAAGPEGPPHAIEILKQELSTTLNQIGCPDYRDLAKFVFHP